MHTILRTLSYRTIKKKQVVAAAHVCSEESVSTTFSRTVAKEAPWTKIAPLYGTGGMGNVPAFNPTFPIF